MPSHKLYKLKEVYVHITRSKSKRSDSIEEASTPRKRRVSISELPRLSRDKSTLAIELHYIKLHLRYRGKRVRKLLGRALRTTVRVAAEVLTLTVNIIAILPFLGPAAFAILMDKITEKLRTY